MMPAKKKINRIFFKQINYPLSHYKNTRLFIFICLTLCAIQQVQSAPFDPALQVTTSITLDGNSISTSGTANQTSIYILTQESVDYITNINNLDAVPALPTNGTLTDINDSIEINSQSTGNDPNAHSGLLTDFTFILKNTSATKTFSVNLEIVTNLSAAVNGGDVAADAKTTIQNNGVNLIADKEAKADVALGLPSDSRSGLQTINLQILPLQTANIMGNVDIIGDTNLLGNSHVGDNWILSNKTKITLIFVGNGIIIPPISIPTPTPISTPNLVPVPLTNQFGLLILSLLILLTIRLRNRALKKQYQG